nr:N-acetylmuramoyl-L-alanine amidase CwlD [Clostridium sp. DJ247]
MAKSKETSVSSTATPPDNLKKVILIDPGHGGMDGGAVSKRGTLEKDINLSISLKLRDKLTENEYIVVMTRDEDKGLYTSKNSAEKMKREDLNNRCNLKRDSNCDLFISIHQNFFPQSKYYGAQVWYCKPDESKLLAQIIQKNLRNDLDNNNKREEQPAGNLYKILRCYCEIPSVIVECGFLSNYNEEIQLQNESYQQKIAESIAKSVREFFELETQQDDKTRPNY